MTKRILLSFLALTSFAFAQEKIKVGNFTFDPAEHWQAKAARGMVKAEVQHGEDGPVIQFYHFGQGQGGGIDANLARWQGQFDKEPQVVVSKEELTFGEQKVSLVEMKGTYFDGPMFGEKTPRANYVLLGAIIPHPSGDVFLKLTAPADAAEKIKADFRALATSPFAE